MEQMRRSEKVRGGPRDRKRENVSILPFLRGMKLE